MKNGERDGWGALLDKVAEGLMVRTDSRLVQPGEVFVALPGTAVHGAQFIADALARGAGYVVTDQAASDLPAEVRGRYQFHADPAQALGCLATAFFKTDSLQLKLVGITGTNGKTTVSYLLEHLLTSAGLKVGLLGTVAYRWPGFSLDAKLTTPDCWTLHELIANMDKSEVDVTVMEVSSHALSQQRVAGLKYDVALFTNLTQDHLDYHQDMEAYFQAKARLFRECGKEGLARVVNLDDPHGMRLAAECPERSVGFGLGPETDASHAAMPDLDVVSGEIVRHGVGGMTLRTRYRGKSWDIDSPLIGAHNASNLLAAQAAATRLGVSCRDMRKLSGFGGVPGRLERVENPCGLSVFVDFAHTPDALESVLSSLRDLDFERLIVVFGCGGDRDRTKRPLMGQAVAKYADVAVATSDNPRHEDPERILDQIMPGLKPCPKVFRQVDRRKALALAADLMTEKDVLVIAGKGHESTQQIGDERLPFNDVDEIKLILEEMHRCA